MGKVMKMIKQIIFIYSIFNPEFYASTMAKFLKVIFPSAFDILYVYFYSFA